ncbi:hypothetical protein ACRW6G_21640 [Escherichia coli]|uniref:hypothetical protein n=1 Tax=Escherichia coli TaxID=562 RepID=UPI0031E35D43
MIKKMWRYLRQIDKYELLQQVISVHEVELLRKMMTDSLLGCSVGYVFSKILKISFLRFIQSEGGWDIITYFLWMLGILIVMVALFIWMCAVVCYELRMYKIKTGRENDILFWVWILLFDVAVVFSLGNVIW